MKKKDRKCEYCSSYNDRVCSAGYASFLERASECPAFTKIEKDEDKTVETSFLKMDDKIVEEIFDPKNGPRFAMWDGEKVEYVGKLLNSPLEYVPILDDAVLEGAVLLPTEAEDFESVQKLVDEIDEHIKKYCDISDDFRRFSAYYVLLSWVYDQINTVNYMRALGDTGSGKSRYLDAVGRLCYKPCIVAGAITPAPIYRMIKRWHGTLVIDEADFRKTDEKDEVITILNCGFERGRPVIRCLKDNPEEVQILPVFGPKILATRRTFYDHALESRCLTEIMKPTQRTDIPPLLPKAFYESEAHLRNKLLMFRFKHYNLIDADAISSVDLGDVEMRLKQATMSFAALFANIPELLEQFRNFLKRYQQELIEERSESREGMIVGAILALKARSWDTQITPKDISGFIEQENGEEIKAHVVGRMLRSLGLRTEKRSKGIRALFWDENQIALLAKRYGYDMPQMPQTPDVVQQELGQLDSKGSSKGVE
jgi:hypothetical protein